MNISLVLLELLASRVQNFDGYQQQLGVLNELISHTATFKAVHIVAYIGRIDEVAPYMSTASGIPKVLITNSFGDINFSKAAGFNRNSFFIAVGSLEQKDWWNRLSNAYAGVQGYARGVFLIPKHVPRPIANMGEHFKWCWQNGFANVIILVELKRPYGAVPFRMFSYDRFPEMRVRKRIWHSTTNYFDNKFIDLRGYHMRAPLLYDPPRVFAWQDPRSKALQVGGYAAHMFKAFLKQRNGGLDIVQQNASNTILDIIRQLNNGEIDVCLSSNIPYDDVRVSYPIRMMPWCILVPASAEIPSFEYFLRPFQGLTWLTSIISLLYLSLLKGVSACILRPHSFQKPDFGRAFLEMLRHMLFMPTPGNGFGWHHVTCFLQATLLGFILSSLYLASLTSLLLSVLFEEQLDTLAEMVQRNLSINAVEYEISVIWNSRGLPKGFVDLLVARDNKDMIQEILNLQQGSAYTAREDFYMFALQQQTRLLQPVFHLAKECITTVPVGFLLPTHTQFEATLNNFILRAASSGLTNKWLLDSWTDGLLAGILHMRKDAEIDIRPLGLEYFDFAWMVMLNGNSLAAVCFLLENLHRITRRFKLFVIYY